MKLSDATALYVGSDEITKVYVGSTEVWSNGGPTPEGLEGEITVGNYADLLYGWSDGNGPFPIFGSISGAAAPYFNMYFMWTPEDEEGLAWLLADVSGPPVLTFQGEEYVATGSDDEWEFEFGSEVTAWPTSGTHKFWLLLPE